MHCVDLDGQVLTLKCNCGSDAADRATAIMHARGTLLVLVAVLQACAVAAAAAAAAAENPYDELQTMPTDNETVRLALVSAVRNPRHARQPSNPKHARCCGVKEDSAVSDRV